MALPTLGVKDKDGSDQTINTLNGGRQAAADSAAVVLATEDKAVFGSPTDAKSSVTDTTSASMIAVLKQISASIQLLAGLIQGGDALQVQMDPTTVNANGRAAAADSAPVVIATEDLAAISGGLSVFRSLDLDESAEQVKASAGKLCKLRMTNFATSPRYVKLYNHASPTVGTTTPIDTIVLPAAESSDACVVTETFGDKGIAFDTALSLACTTALADNDTGAPSANDVVISAYYE